MQENKIYQYRGRGTNKDIINLIHQLTPKAAQQLKGSTILKMFEARTVNETCYKIWSFLKNNIKYIPDTEAQQNVKMPSALIREKKGDCKSYSLFTGAVLTNLKIPFKYAYTSYVPGNKTPSHVYVQTDGGIIIDGVYSHYNKEKPPVYKYLKKA